jgi:hypothetical protein
MCTLLLEIVIVDVPCAAVLGMNDISDIANRISKQSL